MLKVKKQTGQTLVETVVALFILVTGISASVGLADFGLSASTSLTKEIIGTGLAREGIEMVKNMRDTNWLQQTSVNTNCYNFITGQTSPSYPDPTGATRCYQQWLTQTYNLSASSTPQNYLLSFDFSQSTTSSVQFASTAVSSLKYGLNYTNATTSAGFSGFFAVPASPTDLPTPDPQGTSYYRKIILQTISTPPFNLEPYYNELSVMVQVWWTDKNCPRSVDWPGLGKCSLQLQTYLTNWKNY